jgi:hypothetical protein
VDDYAVLRVWGSWRCSCYCVSVVPVILSETEINESVYGPVGALSLCGSWRWYA